MAHLKITLTPQLDKCLSCGQEAGEVVITTVYSPFTLYHDSFQCEKCGTIRAYEVIIELMNNPTVCDACDGKGWILTNVPTGKGIGNCLKCGVFKGNDEAGVAAQSYMQYRKCH